MVVLKPFSETILTNYEVFVECLKIRAFTQNKICQDDERRNKTHQILYRFNSLRIYIQFLATLPRISLRRQELYYKILLCNTYTQDTQEHLNTLQDFTNKTMLHIID